MFKFWEGAQIYRLERGPCLSGKSLLSYLRLELEYDKNVSRISANDAENDANPQRRMKSALQLYSEWTGNYSTVISIDNSNDRNSFLS